MADLSFGAKCAWVAVACTLMFVFLPAAVPSQRTAQDKPPEKKVYDQPLRCYKDQLGDGQHKLICDIPATPSVWTPPPTN
jgi:hypothetical protein